MSKRGYEFRLRRAIIPLSTAGVVLLAVIGELSTPPLVEISDLGSHLDQRLSVIGVVYGIEHDLNDRGPFKLAIHDETFPIAVEAISWDVGHVDVCIGDLIKVTGRAITYWGRQQIVFDRLRDVDLLEARGGTISLATLGEAPHLYLGKPVTICGTLDDGFLVDGSTAIKVKNAPAVDGEILIDGILVYGGWQYHFRAEEWTYT